MSGADVNYRNRRSGPATLPSPLLGLASAGLGVAALARTRALAEAIGIAPTDDVMLALRAVGVRELLVVPGLLMRRRPRRWLWIRVAGDAVDATLFVVAARNRGRASSRLALGGFMLAGITLADVVTAIRAQRADFTGGDASIRARSAITVNRPVDEVYRFWRDLERLPDFMQHVEEVSMTGPRRTRWTVKGPGRRSVSWEADIIADRAGELIAWQSRDGADVTNRGSVRFAAAPGERGTVVTVDLEYEPPFGAAGSLIARMLGEEPVQQMKDDLRRFKQIIETGEITRSESSPEGARALRQATQPNARPHVQRAG